jgi:hypothetical protein
MNKAISCMLWRIKTVTFLAKQTGFEIEEKGKDFQKNLMLVLRGGCKGREIHNMCMNIFE